MFLVVIPDGVPLASNVHRLRVLLKSAVHRLASPENGWLVAEYQENWYCKHWLHCPELFVVALNKIENVATHGIGCSSRCMFGQPMMWHGMGVGCRGLLGKRSTQWHPRISLDPLEGIPVRCESLLLVFPDLLPLFWHLISPLPAVCLGTNP